MFHDDFDDRRQRMVDAQLRQRGIQDERVLAAMLTKRAPGYTGLGFPDPRKLARTPSTTTDSYPAPGSHIISC